MSLASEHSKGHSENLRIANVKKSSVTQMCRHSPGSAELKYRRRIDDLETKHCLQDMCLRCVCVCACLRSRLQNALGTILGASSSKTRKSKQRRWERVNGSESSPLPGACQLASVAGG